MIQNYTSVDLKLTLVAVVVLVMLYLNPWGQKLPSYELCMLYTRNPLWIFNTNQYILSLFVQYITHCSAIWILIMLQESQIYLAKLRNADTGGRNIDFERKKIIDKLHDLENKRVVWITDHNKLIATYYTNEKDG